MAVNVLINKIKFILSLTQSYVYFITVLLLATSFGLKLSSYIHTHHTEYFEIINNFRF